MSYNDRVFEILRKATGPELTEICKALKINDTINIDEISMKYRSAAGHSVLNIFRKPHQLPYKQILIDVAKIIKTRNQRLDYKMEDNNTEEIIEDKISELMKERVATMLNKMNKEKREKKAKEFEKELDRLGYNKEVVRNLSAIIAAGALTGAVVTRLALFGTGVGLVVGIPLLVLTLGGPAYSKTIPTTLLLIAVRKRSDAEHKLFAEI